MNWFLLLLGLLLILLGVWGGPSRRPRPDKTSRIPREATVQEAWDILTSPVEYDDELIKIPEHRSWFLPGSDRRFHQGVAVGLGAGLLVAAIALPFMAKPVAPGNDLAQLNNPPGTTQQGAGSTQPPAGEKPEGSGAAQPPTSGSNQGEKSPAGDQSQPPKQPEAPAKDVEFIIEPGSASQEIAAALEAAGLISSEQAFLDKVAEMGVETSLKAGTFTIPAGASLERIIGELTR